MITNSSSTAAATSDVGTRLEEAVSRSEAKIDQHRLQRLQDVKQRVDSLQKRGLLKRQQYTSATKIELERRFLHSRDSA